MQSRNDKSIKKFFIIGTTDSLTSLLKTRGVDDDNISIVMDAGADITWLINKAEYSFTLREYPAGPISINNRDHLDGIIFCGLNNDEKIKFREQITRPDVVYVDYEDQKSLEACVLYI